MATSFFGGAFFGGEFFNQGGQVVVEEEATRPRPDDGGRKTLSVKRRPIYKPTGLIDRPRTVQERVEQSEQIAREVIEEARGPIEPEAPAGPPPISEMTMAEVEFEIGALLRKRVRTEEDELILLLLMAASAAG